MTEHDEHDPRELPRLAEGLERLSRARLEIPPAIDRAVMREARRRLSGRPRVLTARRVAGALAAAACVALAVLLWKFSTPQARHASPPAAATLASGRVTIVDALRLARAIESGASPTGGDVNGDGAVNDADVEALAMLAVRLEGAG